MDRKPFRLNELYHKAAIELIWPQQGYTPRRKAGETMLLNAACEPARSGPLLWEG